MVIILERPSHRWNIACNARILRQKLVRSPLLWQRVPHNPGSEAILTRTASSSDTIVGALLHDIGQFLPAHLLKGALGDTDVGRPNHASTGSIYLAGLGFPAKVTNIVAQHVASKRYLTATDATYMDALSEASKKSLRQQGGPMSEAERGAFEKTEGWRECLKVRKWDDQAKVVGIESETPRPGSYEEMITQVLEESQAY